jgi:hypothetical protein
MCEEVSTQFKQKWYMVKVAVLVSHVGCCNFYYIAVVLLVVSLFSHKSMLPASNCIIVKGLPAYM